MRLILIVFIIFECISILYAVKISFYSNAGQEKEELKDSHYANILVAIPAHNECLQIRNSITSIKKADYPSDCIDIVLLNDNCTDDTVQIAFDENIQILKLNNHEHTKGGILKTFCLQYRNVINQYDYLCIVDADTLIDHHFFHAANAEFKKGHKIVQGQINSVTYNKNNISCFMSLFQSIINLFMNYQSMLKRSVIISGKGLLISPDILNQIEWDEKNLIEDVDFSFKALLNGYSIYYCSQMKVETKQAYTFKDMWIQQRRWTSGQRQIISKYRDYITNDKLIGVARSFMVAGYINTSIFFLIIISLCNIKIFFIIILSLYFCILVIITIMQKSSEKHYNIRNIFTFPVLLFYWHFICIFSFFKPEKQWKQIKSKY